MLSRERMKSVKIMIRRVDLCGTAPQERLFVLRFVLVERHYPPRNSIRKETQKQNGREERVDKAILIVTSLLHN